MFSPIKKIITYIQRNASSSSNTMFGTANVNADEAQHHQHQQQDENDGKAIQTAKLVTPQHQEQKINVNDDDDDDDEFDIESQIKTSIIDASKMKNCIEVQPVMAEEDDLVEFAPEQDELEENLLELESFPNNEIIVLNDSDLNSSFASDNVSEDPLAIDEFTQPLARDSDNVLDSSSVTTNEEVDTSGDLLWLKLAPGDGEGEEPTTHRGSDGDAPNKPSKTKEDELRSDGGSDSGLGGESNNLTQTHPTNPRDSAVDSVVVAPSPKQPLRSNLKRRFHAPDDMELAEIVGSSSSSSGSLQPKRPKRSINFDNVKVYYFPRQQGFSCVPTTGGCTLGMGARHIAFKTMSLAEHAAELRRAHRNQNQDLQPRGSSSDDTEESEEDYLSEGSGSDGDGDSNGFLQPVSPKQRRTLLKAAGVRKIDAGEKSECRDIRNSREVCGCSCREFCDPETCSCSQAGIKCQVDRATFPCGCTREACGNTVGRVEFNPTRVRTHYIHTVMRLDMEQRQGQQPASLSYSSNSTTAATNSHCYFMQTQSNYSSGYASPAYTPDGTVSYYQQQQQPQPQPLPSSTAEQQSQQAPQQQSNYNALQQPQYALDSLDSSLFTSSGNVTPSYGELLAPATYHSLSFGATQAQMFAYQGNDNEAYRRNFSSCAVPSAPPFGNATTTASNTQYQNRTASMVTTTPTTFLASATSAATTVVATTTDLISLSTPIASSSRLSQINDLLQHNRNTTAALVAVSESPGNGGQITASRATVTTTIDSIDTPPIDDAQRSCVAFEQLPPPPIVAVLERKMPLAPPPSPPPLPLTLPQPPLCPKSTSQVVAPLPVPPVAPQARQPLPP